LGQVKGRCVATTPAPNVAEQNTTKGVSPTGVLRSPSRRKAAKQLQTCYMPFFLLYLFFLHTATNDSPGKRIPILSSILFIQKSIPNTVFTIMVITFFLEYFQPMSFPLNLFFLEINASLAKNKLV
jgi:hypothetical protein